MWLFNFFNPPLKSLNAKEYLSCAEQISNVEKRRYARLLVALLKDDLIYKAFLPFFPVDFGIGSPLKG